MVHKRHQNLEVVRVEHNRTFGELILKINKIIRADTYLGRTHLDCNTAYPGAQVGEQRAALELLEKTED